MLINYKKGKLVVFYGPMFSGKSNNLIDTIEHSNKVKLIFKPKIDSRTLTIRSRTGKELQTINISEAKEILYHLNLKIDIEEIYVDEINFFSDNFATVIKIVLEQGVDVYLAGLDLDYKQEWFDVTKELIELAEYPVQLYARCHRCFKPSIYSVRLINSKLILGKQYPKILVDDERQSYIKYETWCKYCLMKEKQKMNKKMHKKTIKDLINIKGKRILLRVDFNVPLKDGVIQNTARIKAALPTINFLLERGAKLIIFSHLGRIKNEADKDEKSMRPVAKKLQEFLKSKVIFIPCTRGEQLESAINNMSNGEIIVFENTRFEDVSHHKLVKYESKNNAELGKYWASLGDVFVNDAFGTAHRAHASNVGIAQNISESAIGFLIEKEVNFLHNAIENPKRPMVALLGGAKVSDKINVIEALATKADKVIIGTAMCYTFHLAMGKKVGNSLSEPEKVELAKKLMTKYHDKLIIAKDSVATSEFKDVKGIIVDEIPDGMIGMDIGPKTIIDIKEALKDAKTVIWNGPFGVTEFTNFQHGSEQIAQMLVQLKDAVTIIGGGDSAAMVEKMGLAEKFSHISTGGGSSIEFLEGKILPGIECIENK